MAPASAATQPLSFQGLILKLQNYWAEQGCVILQPYDMEVGAGTFHPATTLRALGPQPSAMTPQLLPCASQLCGTQPRLAPASLPPTKSR